MAVAIADSICLPLWKLWLSTTDNEDYDGEDDDDYEPLRPLCNLAHELLDL